MSTGEMTVVLLPGSASESGAMLPTTVVDPIDSRQASLDN